MKVLARFKILILITLPFLPLTAEALPGSDLIRLATVIDRAVQRMEEYKESVELRKEKIEQMAEIGKQELDAKNQAYAEMAAREGRAEMQKRDKTNIEKMLPSSTVCKNVVQEALSDSIQCAVGTAIRNESLGALANKSAFVRDQKAAIRKSKQLVNAVQEGQGRIFNAPEDQDPNEPFEPLALDPSYIMSSAEAFTALDEKEFEAGSNYIELLIPSINFTGRGLSEMQGYEALSEMKKEATLMLSRTILMDQLQRRKALDPFGVGMEFDSDMAYYRESLFGEMEPAAVAAIGNGNASTPTMLLRDKLTKQKLAAQMQLDAFKSSLKDEAVRSLLLIQVLEKGGF